nr:protein kinase-like domain, phloem protein 2-like protein [Tanacetum cinerariifolium]
MKAIRQVLRYVKATKDYRITYKHNGGNKIHGYSNSSYGINTQEGKGTTGIIFYYGESPISWSTQKQATVSLSSCESEFIAPTQVLWLKRLLSKLTHSEEDKVTIRVDNKSSIALMKNPAQKPNLSLVILHPRCEGYFGLSKMGHANQQYSLLIAGALGTRGYCDPVFLETYSLTKESDVYSFGVVFLEILSGKLCVENTGCELKVYVPSWKKSYEENKLNEIILQNLMQQMDPSSLKTFLDIAFQYLQKSHEERPTMPRVVEELEIALESHEFHDLRVEMLTKHEDILKGYGSSSNIRIQN